MSPDYSAPAAADWVREHLGSLPLLSTELLCRALDAGRQGDSMKWPATLLAQLALRMWLYPPSDEEGEQWLERIPFQWGRGHFFTRMLEWAQGQADRRTYEIPQEYANIAKTEVEQFTLNMLKDDLYKWSQSSGVIAFLGNGTFEDTLLPFKLGQLGQAPHEPVADFGLKDALSAIQSYCGNPALRFTTMGIKLPPAMTGKSGALALWFALHARNIDLPCMPLDVGLAGCLWGQAMDYQQNSPEIVRRKWTLFCRACVPVVILPNTMGEFNQHSCECQLWPLNEPLHKRMEELVSCQIERQPTAKLVKKNEDLLLGYKGKPDFHGILSELKSMEDPQGRNNDAHRINLLAFLCCCQLSLEPEATEREKNIVGVSMGQYSEMDLRILTLSIEWVDEVIQPRILKMINSLRKSIQAIRNFEAVAP